MGFKCGIVGLPNVGKSTLFNALTRQAFKPLTTRFVRLSRMWALYHYLIHVWMRLAAIVKPIKFLPTTMEFVDIAGLVAGASQGEGLGNKFLAHIRETDGIAQVVRALITTTLSTLLARLTPLPTLTPSIPNWR